MARPRTEKQKRERNWALWRELQSGLSLGAVGAKFGIGSERVRQIRVKIERELRRTKRIEERLNKLRAWIYLRAPADMWMETLHLGLSEPQVMQMSEERLKVVAVAIIVGATRRGRGAALKLAAELEQETGYGFKDMAAARKEVSETLVDIINHPDQGGVPPPEPPAQSAGAPGY